VVVSFMAPDGIIVSSDSPSKPPVQFSGSTIVFHRLPSNHGGHFLILKNLEKKREGNIELGAILHNTLAKCFQFLLSHRQSLP
jgi:hypothetical protein